MTIEQMQFASVVVMVLLTLKLLMLRIKGNNRVLLRAKSLMIGGTTLIGLQFLLQLLLGWRLMGVTQGVMLNMALFIPASWLLSLTILMLQRQGRLNQWDKWIGGLTWGLTLGVMAIAVWKGGEPLPCDTPELRMAEKIGGGIYVAMQSYYLIRHFTNLGNMQVEMDNYYDQDMSRYLHWMRLSIVILMILAIIVPFVIYASNTLLLTTSLLAYLGIPYFVDSFCYYVKSTMPAKVLAAEKNAEEDTKTATNFSPEKMQRVDKAVEQWMAHKGHLKSGILMPIAAAEMGIPKYLLSAWLSQQGKKFNPWLADLRVEEAKHQLKEHPEWSNDAIAQYCGFSDRTTLQRTFKEKTGLTPTQFIQENQ